MFFNVRDLEVRKAHFDVTISEGEIDYVEGLRQTGPLQAEGTAELLGNTLGEIRVRGRLKVTMEAECDRCLEKARFPIASDFDLFYRPSDTGPGGEEVGISDAESEVGFYEGEGVESERFCGSISCWRCPCSAFAGSPVWAFARYAARIATCARVMIG